jgi:hypothetical protein
VDVRVDAAGRDVGALGVEDLDIVAVPDGQVARDRDYRAVLETTTVSRRSSTPENTPADAL